MASAVIGALRVFLSADTAEFKRGLSDAERAAEKFGRAIGSTLRSGLLAVTAAASAGAVALTALTVSSFNTISAQVDLARRVGASVAAIQTLQHATELAGGSSEALGKALGVLNARLGEAAREGAGPAFEAIQRLGLSVQELSRMDADEKIKAISDKMKELNYSTEQQADTLKQLGIRNQEIINLFQEGSQAINESRAELQAWGVLLSDVDAAKVEAAGDAWDKIKTVLTGVGNQIAIRVAPLITAIAGKIGDAAKETGGFGDAIDKAITLGVRLFGAINREIYQFRVDLDQAIAEILDLFDTIAGAPVQLLKSIFGGEDEDWGFSKINKSYGQLKETLEKPLSDEGIIAWLAEVRKKADEAALAATKVTKTIVTDDNTNNVGPTEAEQKEEEKLREKLARKLETIQESLLTEREAEMAHYQERLALVNAAYDQELLSTKEYADLKLRIEQEHADAVMDLNEEVARDAAANVQKQLSAYETLANDVGTVLDAIFGESKLVAIAQAIINTAQAVTRNLAEYPGPLGFAMAAAAAAAGAAQIATIMRTTKTSKGGGGSSGLAGGAAAANSAAAASRATPEVGSNQTLFINGLTTGSLFSGESVRELAEKLIDFQRDGGKIVLGPA